MISRTATLPLFASAIFIFSSAPALGSFTTGFEQPTYVSGALSGQDSWTNSTTPRVQTGGEIATELSNAGLNPADPVHGGSQAVIVTGTGGSSATIRPISGLDSASTAVLDVWARPLTPGAAGSTVGTNLGNIFMTMEDSSNVRAAAFRFGATVVDTQLTATSIDVFTEPAGWVPTGVQWQADNWYNVRLEPNYSAKTYDVHIDGTQVLDNVVFYDTDSTGLSQIRIFRGSGQAGMIIDDLSVVPEPSSLGLFLVACALMLLKQRR